MTARSVLGSVPTILAVRILPLLKVTCTLDPVAVATTWLFVTM